MTPKTIIFIGLSGSGKGTQAKLLKSKIEPSGDVFHLESGALFRDFIKNSDTNTASVAGKINEEGKLQPQFLSVYIWSRGLIDNVKEETSLIIDGTPRRLAEAHVLETAFEFYGRENVHVVYLKVSEEVVIERLNKRGREDDLDESDILEKINWFKKDVMPVIDYYKSNDYYHFHEVDGEKTEEEIHQDIQDILE